MWAWRVEESEEATKNDPWSRALLVLLTSRWNLKEMGTGSIALSALKEIGSGGYVYG